MQLLGKLKSEHALTLTVAANRSERAIDEADISLLII
jgi:hypothetical protein